MPAELPSTEQIFIETSRLVPLISVDVTPELEIALALYKNKPRLTFYPELFSINHQSYKNRGHTTQSGTNSCLSMLAPSVKGNDGSVSTSLIGYGKLNAESKQSFPVELIDIIKRKAEDVLLGDSKDENARDALMFIVDVTNGRNALEEIRKG